MLSAGYFVSVLHLLTLVLGLGAVTARALALRRLPLTREVRPVFFADNLYGIAALLWIGTGLWRAFGGIDKGSEFYLSSPSFWVKMALFGVVLLLEILPMITLIRWRLKLAKGDSLSFEKTELLARLTVAEIPVLILIVFAAVAMADGF